MLEVDEIDAKTLSVVVDADVVMAGATEVLKSDTIEKGPLRVVILSVTDLESVIG